MFFARILRQLLLWERVIWGFFVNFVIVLFYTEKGLRIKKVSIFNIEFSFLILKRNLLYL